MIAASDYVRAVPEQIRAWVPAPYRTLGTDGFGRSDTRAQLRDFFEVGRDWIVLQALDSLGRAADVQAARAAGRGNAPDAALGAVKHGEAAAPLRHGRLPAAHSPPTCSRIQVRRRTCPRPALPPLVAPIPFAARPQPEPRGFPAAITRRLDQSPP